MSHAAPADPAAVALRSGAALGNPVRLDGGCQPASGDAGAADIASLFPAGPFGLTNFAEAWSSGHFPLWYFNTILLCGGILAVQCVTISLAGYAFARLRFRYRETLFYLFLLQLMLVPPILIVPNMTTLIALHLYDTLPGVMAPYCASAFGVFLMRQTFRTIPRDYEEAALVDGASRLAIIFRVLLPLGATGPGRVRHRLGDRALERIPLAADGDLIAIESGADSRARVIHLRAPRRDRNGASSPLAPSSSQHRCW